MTSLSPNLQRTSHYLMNASFVEIQVPAMRATIDCHLQTEVGLRPNITKRDTLKARYLVKMQPAPMERANFESSTRWNHRRFKHAMVGKAFGPVLNGKLPTDNISSGVGTVP